MTKALVTAKGISIQLGRELGKGGEGSVFEVPALPNQVAKLYHRAIEPEKQAKLAFMAAHGDQHLLSYAAWPQDTLHKTPRGPVAGFLMPKVVGRDPIHMLYSPAYRRQQRPKAAWDFLLFAARNVAAAFDVLHAHGHVLGDVNENSVMVGSDSKVVLIDCDSFQINANGKLHPCEVGVPIFTPPELQGLPTFRGVTRTANHDNFGLALHIFHLLFGGRHPFSGVPLRKDVGEALEADIKAFRYAYGRDGQSRGMAPPPKTIPMSLIPDSMETMFHLAFTERGAAGPRPAAQQWLLALDALRKRLTKCSTTPMHVYPDHLARCPWCELEHKGVVYFVDLGSTFTATASGFVLPKAWALIEAVQPPPQVSVPNIDSIAIKPKVLPPGIPGKGQALVIKALVLVIGIGLAMTFTNLWLLWAIAGFIAWNMADGASSSKRNEERRRRERVLELARQEFERLSVRACDEAGPEGFYKKKQELVKLRDEYQGLPAKEKSELDLLRATAEQRQKHQFLDRCFIGDASIPGVGSAKKAALRSFGIETAADVDWNKVRAVKGFGEVLTRAVVDWKKSCERRFVFNSRNAVSEADKNSVRARLGARKKQLEAALSGGAAELERYRQDAAAKVTALHALIQPAATKFAQARADLSVF